jgi:isopentenyl diphosphate isomerase/L-lactate dehydrogenase-like FMN-dependent dehydrogenase
MTRSSLHARYRREFLKFLAASPLMAYGFREAFAQDAAGAALAKDVLSVMDFEALARPKLPPAHWGYMASGTDDNLTLQANVAAYKTIQLRPRRLVDVSKIDTGVELFGQRFASPVFLCPVGGHRMFHAEGEVATARAARARNTMQVLSTQTSIRVEDVAAARGGGLWYQLYMPTSWDDTEKMVRRVEAAGCPVLVWTIDLLGGRNLETATRARLTDTRQCIACHATATGGRRETAMFTGLSSTRFNPSNATWDWIGRLKKMTSMKVVIKGVETGEDARLARENGADAVLVSNHGGRAAETLRPTIDIVPEVVDAVNNQIPVLVDGGVRRGSDAFKAIASGARAVGIGRPYTWGLAAFGQDGVERVIDILNAELTLTMRQCGTPTLAQITKAHVRRL